MVLLLLPLVWVSRVPPALQFSTAFASFADLGSLLALDAPPADRNAAPNAAALSGVERLAA